VLANASVSIMVLNCNKAEATVHNDSCCCAAFEFIE